MFVATRRIEVPKCPFGQILDFVLVVFQDVSDLHVHSNCSKNRLMTGGLIRVFALFQDDDWYFVRREDDRSTWVVRGILKRVRRRGVYIYIKGYEKSRHYGRLNLH